MCGIAGVLELDTGAQASLEGLRRMARVLHHRGPDAEGFYHEGQVGLAHRRLSIIDLEAGKQPMSSPDGKVVLVFNGEIYNYPELKAELEAKGHVFRTRSDTEVLLAMYLQYGLEAFPKMNGMFACAFWDARARQIVLARDRFGKKPLFYYHHPRRFIFGSEIKALLAHGGIERKVNLAALHEYLSHSYIVGEHTIIEGIRRVPPAHVLVLKNGQIVCRPYWELKFEPVSNPPEEGEVLERLEELLEGAVRRRLMSDVPLGAFLSGGLDSSAVVAAMARLCDRPVCTFTIGFDESGYSEIEDARVVAKYLGTDHHEMIVKPSALDVLEDLVWYLDEPFADSSALPTYYVCREARQHVTVALSGDGGDETFAGYRRYLDVNYYRRMGFIPSWIRRSIITSLTHILPFTFPGWNYMYALGSSTNGGIPYGLGIYPYIREKLYTPELKRSVQDYDPFEQTEQLLGKVAHLDPVSRYQYLDTLQYLSGDILTKADRMSMANSLEVRSPLLDHTLVEYMATLPVSLKLRDGVRKYVFRKVCGRLLPPSVLTKRKQGFAIPKDLWFQGQLRTFANEVLLDSRTISRGYFRENTVKQMLKHHSGGHRDYSDWIWCLIVLEMWSRIFIDQQLQIDFDTISYGTTKAVPDP